VVFLVQFCDIKNLAIFSQNLVKLVEFTLKRTKVSIFWVEETKVVAKKITEICNLLKLIKTRQSF
jgi:hypothetical protein